MNSVKIKAPRLAKNMGFGLIAFSFLFYFLPDFALIDVVPDIIMYMFLCLTLGKLSYLNDSVEHARKLFLRMIFISAAKYAAILVTFGSGNAEEQASMMLLMVFVFAIFECLTLIPAYIGLFDGLLYLGTRNNGTAVFGISNEHKKRSYTDKIKRLTVIFVIVKNLAVLLPETAALSTTDNINSYKISMYEFIPHFRICGIIISFVFGIVWLARVIKYFRSLSKDKSFVCALCEKYNNEIIPNTKIFAERKIGLACLFFGIFAILTVDFYINGNNGYNIIPDIIPALAALVGFIILKKYIPRQIFIISNVACVIYGFITTVNWKLVADFSYQYTAAQVRTNAEASRMWKALVAMSALEALCFFALSVVVIVCIMKIVQDHTGYCVEHYTVDPKVRLKELHSKLNLLLKIACGTAFLAASGGVFRVYMFRYATELADVSWIIETALTVIFAAILVFALFQIYDEVKEKYMY